MRKVVFVIVATLFFSGCCSKMKYPSPDQMVAQALEVVKTITVDELNKLMDSEEIYTLIDVRQKSEHYYGYIPGSLVIPRGSLEFLIGNEEYWETEGLYMPLKEETIIVYCKKGSRGALAANSLMQLGYDNVYTLDGGWKKWELTYPDFTEKNLDMLSGGNEEEHDVGSGC